jgi:hypothetical protein
VIDGPNKMNLFKIHNGMNLLKKNNKRILGLGICEVGKKILQILLKCLVIPLVNWIFNAVN